MSSNSAPKWSASYLASLTPEERASFLSRLTPDELKSLQYDWTFWSRPEQRAPSGHWHTWLILAGRGAGKTRSGAEWVRAAACGATPLTGGRYRRIALVAETAADARDVMVEGPSGLLAIHPPAFRPKFEASKRRLTWPNGAVATLYNATEPDQLRGPQHDAAWCDELAKWRYARETWDMLQFGLRLGDDPRQVITTTPRPIPIIRDLIVREASGVALTRGTTYDNRANLARNFFDTIVKHYEGTRLGRQELNAELIDDVAGALWTRALLDRYRVAGGTALASMQRVVVGIGYQADALVVEINQGGAMVEAVLRAERAGLPLRQVRASRGKTVRAEPIAALYEQGRVSHAGAFPALEDEMVLFTPFGIEGGGAADRVDALVWALSDLFPRMVRPQTDVAWDDEAGGGGNWLA